ncbi:hypothetical protein D915_008088 [Fasciola hepatica]|uniref:EGF-like domain-containing protein n=1 Tax=Fasciola hepatica TaxID=6192 RepID=A0A4E0R049_FASHE|nr:hypothetical protein D915_008088 [Fasciola hepatica]
MRMQMYVPNMIHVHTTMKNIYIRLATRPEQTKDWIEPDEIYETVPTVEGLYEAQIPYYIPFYDPNLNSDHWHQLHVLVLLCSQKYCPIDMIKSVELQYTVNPSSLLILAELTKTEYYPRETVRGRFVALTSQDTWYMVDKIKTPEYYIERMSPFFKKVVRQSDIMTPFSPNFTCASLRLLGPDQLVWRSWLHVNATSAIYFDMTLEQDAPLGLWSVELRCLNQKRMISFMVKQNISMPFLTYNLPPQKVAIDSPAIHTRVCARHHTGTFVQGEAAVMICVCENEYRIKVPTSITEAEKLFNRQYCPAHFDSEARKCVIKRKKLHGRECEDFNISTIAFSFDLLLNSGEDMYILFCHQVTSERNNAKVTKCEYSLPISSREADMNLDLDYAYRSGLPIHMVATINHPGLKTLAGYTIEVEISQLPAACAFAKSIPSEPGAFVTYFARRQSNTSANGQAVFTFPPVRGTPFLQVRALLRQFGEDKFIHTQVGHMRDGLAAEKILKAWPSTSGALLQVWPGEHGRLRTSCRDAPLPVKLMSNRPLKNRTIWMEGVFSGLHLVQRFPPMKILASSNQLSQMDPDVENSDECIDQDDHIRGHFICERPDSDKILCRKGWEGNDCLDAICSQHCHPAGSWCSEPDQCQCKGQWTGDNCDECIACTPDLCSTINYIPCVCEMPSVNYTCAALKTVKQRRTPSRTPHRTIYERTINVTVFDRYLTGAYVTFYFYEPYGNGKLERISAGAFIETTDCLPPAYYAPRKIENVQTADMDKISLTVRHPKEYLKSVGLNQCHFRTIAELGDSHSGPYQTGQLRYSEALQEMWSLPWKINPMDNSEEMFQSAGLVINSSHYLARLELDSACPQMVISTDSYHNKFDFTRRAIRSRKLKSPTKGHVYSYNSYQPEWIFSSVNSVTDKTGELVTRLQTRIPSYVKYFQVQAYCTTGRSGLWISEYLKAEKPWLLRSRLLSPKRIVQGEIVHFHVMVETSRLVPCGQIDVYFDGSSAQFTSITASNVTLCLCSGQHQLIIFRKTAQKYGFMNLTSKTTLKPSSPMCSYLSSGTKQNDSLTTELSSTENYEIYVEPRGFKEIRHFRTLICSDVDTGFKTQINMATHPGLWPLMDAIGPVQYRATCSLNLFWEMLNRLHEANSYDLDTGEQLALNLLSSGILHAYLRNNRVRNVHPLGQQSNPLRRRQMYLSQQITRFKHRDGSISIYGQRDTNGSVWLTALMLRGLAWAARSNIYPDYTLISALVGFLEKQINTLSGCFQETGSPLPFVLHGVRGQLNRALHETLLTAYVFIALNENPVLKVFSHDKDIQSRVGKLAKMASYCLFNSYPGDRPNIEFDTLSNMAVAMLTYAFHLVPEIWDTIGAHSMSVLNERLTTTLGSWGNMTYLADNSDLESAQFEASPVSIEATAYYALLMSHEKRAMEKQTEVIKYLVSFHDFYPNSRLTHSTVMVLLALTKLAAENLDPYGSETVALGCLFQFHPTGVSQKVWFSYPDKHLSKWGPVKTIDATDSRELMWEARNLNQHQCVLAQAELTYYLPPHEDTVTDTLAKFRVYVRQIEAIECAKPTVEICMGINKQEERFQPNLPLDTGTLVMEIRPPSNFAIDKVNLLSRYVLKQSDEDRHPPRHMEIGLNNELLILFDGWTEEEARAQLTIADLRRCIQLSFDQVYHTERARPLLIKSYDLHRLYSTTRGTFKFPDCLPFVNGDERTAYFETYEPVTETPCPVCSSDLKDMGKKLQQLFTSRSKADVILFKSVETSFRLEESVILFTTRLVNRSSYWFTQVHLPNRRCQCRIAPGNRFAIAYTDVPFDCSSTDPVFDFKVSENTNMIHFVLLNDPSPIVRYFRETLVKPEQCWSCFNLMKILQKI